MAHPIEKLIQSVAGELLNHPKSRAQILWKHWVNLFGPQIAAHAEPVRLSNGVLTVRVDASAWITELTFLKPDLLGKLQNTLPPGSIRDIRFQQGTLSQSVMDTSAGYGNQRFPVLPPPSSQEQERAQQACHEVMDPELQATLRHFLITLQVHQRHQKDLHNIK